MYFIYYLHLIKSTFKTKYFPTFLVREKEKGILDVPQGGVGGTECRDSLLHISYPQNPREMKASTPGTRACNTAWVHTVAA